MRHETPPQRAERPGRELPGVAGQGGQPGQQHQGQPGQPRQERPGQPGQEARQPDHQQGADQSSGGKRAVLAAFAANLGIAATKFAAFVVTGSASMLAESVHSVADSGNQALLLLGRSRARREETEEHQFGFGSERYFYGFLVAMVLFTVGALFSIYEGVTRISHPEHVTDPVVALVVLGIATVLESLSFRTAVRESNHSRGTRGWRSFIRRAKAPELPVVLLEDFAALIGLLLAFGGVVATVVTGNPRFDGAGSVCIGVLLGCVATILAVEMKSLLIGESATPEVERAIVDAAEAGPEVERVIHLRTLHVGPETLLVAAKIAVRVGDSAASVAEGINQAERRIRTAVPIAELIYLEPDVYQPGRADAADPAVRAARRPGLRAAGRSAARVVRRSRPG